MIPPIKHKGVALVIDEQLGPKNGDKINTIVKRIASHDIPYWGCKSTDEALKFLCNLVDVSFIVLDWNLSGMSTDIATPEHINARANVLFLKEMRKYSFAPVIILSSLDSGSIITEIQKIDPTLYNSDKTKNFILVKRKDSVAKKGQLLRTINKWIATNPTIYTLKVWEDSFFKAKHETFWSLFEKSPVWPRILWDTYEKDSIDESINIYDAINRLIAGRVDKRVLKIEHVKGNRSRLNIVDVKKVISETMYVDDKQLTKNDIQPGDIFLKGSNYFINIRAECDTINRDRQKSPDSIKLYLLKCEKLKNKQSWKDRHNKTTGIVQRLTDFCLFGVDDQNFFRIKYKEVTLEDYGNLKRVRRLISPHVNFLQQGYAAYCSRSGLPRIPEVVVRDIAKTFIKKNVGTAATTTM